jgi:hypothetical protein
MGLLCLFGAAYQRNVAADHALHSTTAIKSIYASAGQFVLRVNVGPRCDNSLRAQVRFLADPALPFCFVSKTYEQCPTTAGCGATEIIRRAERAAFEAAVADSVQGR